MQRLALTLTLLLVTVTVGGAAEKLSQAEKAKLATEVKALFTKKCSKCHGPEGVRTVEGPYGEFDFVLDLERLSSDPAKIIRGDPDESKLFNMVETWIMPDENAGEEPLPDEEIELIRRWILAGAPTEKGQRAATKYQCPATKKFSLKRDYSPEQIERGQYSTRLEEVPEGVFLSRCSFSSSAAKLTCDRHKVDRVEYDETLKIKKYYVFPKQYNFQLFPDLSSVADDGRGSVQYGQCEFVSP